MAKNGTTELSSQYFWPRTGHIQVISIFGHLYAHTDTYENNNIINTIIVWYNKICVKLLFYKLFITHINSNGANEKKCTCERRFKRKNF